jgi:hypothetical protein
MEKQGKNPLLFFIDKTNNLDLKNNAFPLEKSSP